MKEFLILGMIIMVSGMGTASSQEACEQGQIILNGQCADPSEISREDLKITLNTESSYSTGDTVQISGSVSRIDSDYHLTILVTNPAGDIVLAEQMPPKSNGGFSAKTVAKGPLWENSGTYKVVASYDNKKETVSFVFSNTESRQEPEKIEQQELEQKEPQKKELPVAQFVDETKDPKDYITRYRTETEYKDWFDENYSEYPTIYEAVGLPSWMERLFDWQDAKALSEKDVSNAINYMKTQRQG